jgi:cytochrome c oxidase assembly factor CtaG
VITNPIVAILVFTGMIFLWHFLPGWYDAAVEDDTVHYIQHLSFAATAFLFWWNVIDPAPLHARMGYLQRIVYVIAAGTGQAVISAFITMAPDLLYRSYLAKTPILPIDPMSDQALGGMIMWVPGQLLNLGVVGILFGVWAVQSERRQRQIETRADLARARSSSPDW